MNQDGQLFVTGISGNGGLSATVDALGDVFTAGAVANSSGILWTVRKLSCLVY